MPKTIYKATTSLADGGLNFLLSSPFQEDTYGDIVGDETAPDYGWDLTVHRANPVCFYGHDTSTPPIARWENVGVRDQALRGTLIFAPRGVSRFADEISDLTSAGIVRGCSVGFRPTKSKPRANGATHWLRQTLLEASLVGVPALPSALLEAKGMGISQETIQRVFKDIKPLSIGERIRRARAAVRKAQSILSKTTDERSRQVLMRAIAVLEQEDHERMAASRQLPPDTSAQKAARARARAEAVLRQVDARIARDEAASFVGQHRQAHAETIAKFESQSRAYTDPPKAKGEPQTVLTWRGQKIRIEKWKWDK
jgi:DNA-binding transcriptional regulator YhcF (GntR family)